MNLESEYININYVSLFDFVNKNLNHITKIKTKYLALLSELTISPEISDEKFLDNLKKINNIGLVIIGWINLSDFSSEILTNFEIICSGTIIIEPKIIRSGLSVGHIEDIVVDSKYRGKKISQNLLNKLKNYANDNNCYKVILDCDQSVCGVYESNGFEIKGIQMGQYL